MCPSVSVFKQTLCLTVSVSAVRQTHTLTLLCVLNWWVEEGSGARDEVVNDHFPRNHIHPLTISSPSSNLCCCDSIATLDFHLSTGFAKWGPNIHLMWFSCHKVVGFIILPIPRLPQELYMYKIMPLKGFDTRQRELWLRKGGNRCKCCNWSNRSAWHTAAAVGEGNLLHKCSYTLLPAAFFFGLSDAFFVARHIS